MSKSRPRLRPGEIDGIEAALGRRGFYVHRPIIVHTAREEITGEVCPCGCGSTRAVAISTRQHIDVIIDVWKGKRSVRSKLSPEKQAKFDELAESGAYERIYMPLRCSVAQEQVALDKRTTVISINGGQRAGKTTVALEWLTDRILEWGGRGAKFLWLAPTREMFWVGLNKMVNGEANDRNVRAVIDPRLVVSKPRKITDQEHHVVLVDGTRIYFKHAGENGDNIRAVSVRGAVFDEATAKTVGPRNLDVLLGRITDSGGQLLIPTTPQTPHWMKDRVVDKCVSYEDAHAMEKAGEGWPAMVAVKITAYDNPWQDPAIIDELIEIAGGKDAPGVRREWFGEWIVDGNRLWPAFVNGPPYVVEDYTSRNVEAYGWINITHAVATGRFGAFEDLLWANESRRVDKVLGLDFNFGGLPPSAAVCKIICRRDQDVRNPANWVLYVEDEIVREMPDEWEWFRFLANDAVGVLRETPGGAVLPRDYFHKAACVGDATGFQEERVNKALPTITAIADAGLKMGFDIIPPMRNNKGTASNGSREARFSFVRGLLRKRESDGMPRLLVNARCREAIFSFENEVDEGGRGRNDKKAGSRADRMSGITDAICYAAQALLYNALEESGLFEVAA